MKYDEIVKVLRFCSNTGLDCRECPYYDTFVMCVDRVQAEAADAIENLQAELAEERYWRDRIESRKAQVSNGECIVL